MGLRRLVGALGEGLSAAAGAGKIDELSNVAGKAQSLEVSANLTERQGGPVEIHVRSSRYGAYGSAHSPSGSPVAYHPKSSLADALRAVAKEMKAQGRLDVESIKCRSAKSPVQGTKLKDLCVAAMCEAFGERVPTSRELASRREAHQTAAREKASQNRATRKELLALLAEGLDGVSKWNRQWKKARSVAPFKKVDLGGKDLAGVRLVSMLEGRFVETNLSDADLRKAGLRRSDFGKATLKKASLREADLRDVRFVGADLRGADLSCAQVQGADFTGACLDGADWWQTQFDEKTVWPAGFDLPEPLTWAGKGPSPAALAAIARKKATEGPIDLAAFMKRLEKSLDKPRMKKALSMLKKESFQLFVETSDTQLAGVVKSQNDPDLVYSGILEASGAFSCCTQNLNVCGGLRGALCKHLLVLIIGLAQSGEVDADTLDDWVQRSALQQPKLQKDVQSAIFLRYKGAEAGEIDWRPTETVPEDFYAY